MNMLAPVAKETAKPEAGWMEKYLAFKENYVSHPSISSINDLAIERFKSLGFPSRKDEMYTYVNLKELIGTEFDFRHGDKNETCALAIGENIFEGCEKSVITLVNGAYDPALSDISGAGGRIKISPLALALKDADISRYFKEITKGENDLFASLNTAFMADCLIVEIEPNKKLSTPLLILNYSTGSTSKPIMTTPRILIRAGEYSESDLIIKNVWEGGNHFVNASFDFLMGKKAKLNLVQTQNETRGKVWSFSKTRITMEKESEFVATQASLGATLGRSHLEAHLKESGARFTLAAIAILSGAKQSHNYVRVHHQAPDCTSDQLFKTVVKEKSRSSVDTTLIAHKGATGTGSNQLVKNLLLTGNGHADTKPNLMIYTDDVQCAHGATTSEISEDELIYLKTRGLTEQSAKALLIEGFVASALGGINNRAIAEDIKTSLLQRNGGGNA